MAKRSPDAENKRLVEIFRASARSSAEAVEAEQTARRLIKEADQAWTNGGMKTLVGLAAAIAAEMVIGREVTDRQMAKQFHDLQREIAAAAKATDRRLVAMARRIAAVEKP